MCRFPLFCWNRSPGFVWFRVLGYGTAIKDTRRHRLTFSQHNGMAWFARVGQYIVEPLTRGGL